MVKDHSGRKCFLRQDRDGVTALDRVNAVPHVPVLLADINQWLRRGKPVQRAAQPNVFQHRGTSSLHVCSTDHVGQNTRRAGHVPHEIGAQHDQPAARKGKRPGAVRIRYVWRATCCW
eukprot:4834581-Prymnesium_polylepis.1